MGQVFRKEFQLKHFRFVENDPKKFYVSQWSDDRKKYLIFRLVIFVYSFVWFIIHMAFLPSMAENYILYLTNWTEVVFNLYLLIALSVSLHGFLLQKTADMDAIQLQWFHKFVWLLLSVTFALVFMVDFLFWCFIANSIPASFLRNPVVIHLHAVNFLLICADILIMAVPIRLLHFVYSLVVPIIYVLFTLVLYWTGGPATIYPILDWQREPTTAALFCGFGGFGAIMIAHVCLFFLYKVRVWLTFKCRRPEVGI